MKLEQGLRATLLERHRKEALTLVAEAMGRWRAEGYLRYDDRENSCTVRVFSWMLTLLDAKADGDPVQIIPVVEGITPNAEQLAGRSSVATAKRPDIVLFLGGNHAVRMSVECKRFTGSANAREYAENGILRFLAAGYVTDAGRGAMIGYVMSSSIAQRVAQINMQIRGHAAMGEDHQLSSAAAIAPIDDVCSSTHASSGITLTHLFLDMRTVVRDRQGLLRV